MIINQQSSNSIQTNGLQSSQFTLETNSTIFDMLTSKVYSDPLLASIREISTNAIDGCLQADKPVAFDVHLPTEQEPYFSVRDYGSGMSPDQIQQVYTTMGASTKRDSNDFNGCMG